MNQALPAKTISLGSDEAPADNSRLSILCGERHSNIGVIEQELLIKCYQQGSEFVLQGKPEQIDIASKVLRKLYALTQNNAGLQQSKIYQIIRNMSEPEEQEFEFERVQAPLRQVVAKSKAQSDYMNAIDNADVVFGIGPAGTGKTYLAVAKAVDALINDEVERIVLCDQWLKQAKIWGFCRVILGRRLIPIYVHCMTHCMSCWALSE